MSKSGASESKDSHESEEIGRKRGAGDEEKENEEGILDFLSVATLTLEEERLW